MRNLFALIQGIRDAQDEGWEEAEDYQRDEGEYDEDFENVAEAVLEEEDPQEDEDENYEGWDDEPEEAPKAPKVKARQAKRKATKSFVEDPPSTPKSSKRRNLGKLGRLKALSRSKTWASSEAATPKPKLPRANTDESYVDHLTANKEQQLAELMGEIEALRVTE